MLQQVEDWLSRYEAGELDRRAFLTGVAALAAGAGVQAQSARSGLTAAGLHHVEIKTLDPERSRDFYAELLGLKPLTRGERFVLPLGNGEGRGYLAISRGPIERVDHFSVKVPGMHARDPRRTAERLGRLGYQVRQTENRLLVTDPDKKEVELQAPSTTL
jgi:catechol 2,3-dioxygenase-like lactoylglutathione lyase family enzyme